MAKFDIKDYTFFFFLEDNLFRRDEESRGGTQAATNGNTGDNDLVDRSNTSPGIYNGYSVYADPIKTLELFCQYKASNPIGYPGICTRETITDTVGQFYIKEKTPPYVENHDIYIYIRANENNGATPLSGSCTVTVTDTGINETSTKEFNATNIDSTTEDNYLSYVEVLRFDMVTATGSYDSDSEIDVKVEFDLQSGNYTGSLDYLGMEILPKITAQTLDTE